MAGGFDNATIDQYAAYLKAYWALSDTSDEIGGHTLVNTDVDFTQAGIRGNCGTFDGNDKLVAASHTDFNLFDNDWCINFWFNQIQPLNGQYSYFSVGSVANNALVAYADTRRLFVEMYNSVSGNVVIYNSGAIGTWDPAVGWHDLMISHNGTDYYVHVDGSQVKKTTDAKQIQDANQPVNIGYQVLGNYYYPQKEDEYALWNGMSFANEAAVDSLSSAIWNSGAGRFWSEIIESYLTRDVSGILDRTASGVLVRELVV